MDKLKWFEENLVDGAMWEKADDEIYIKYDGKLHKLNRAQAREIDKYTGQERYKTFKQVTYIEYNIEVSMAPHPWDNKENPYFWYIKQIVFNGSSNAGCGWAKTPEQAWRDAKKYYERFYTEKTCT